MKTIKSKIVLNLVSNVIPMLSGLVTIPRLIESLGIERFGILSIGWMLVGYFGLLDMGLGRALTQKVADRLGSGHTKQLKGLILRTVFIIFLMGCLGCALLSSTSSYLALEVFKISAAYHYEVVNGIYWLALTIPFVIASTALLGVLEGQQNFGWTALVRGPLGVLMFVIPLIVVQWTASLDWIFFWLFLIRLSTLIVLIFIVINTTKLYQGWNVDKQELKSLFMFGGWVTISNIISPMMVYFDRFYIASTLSAAVVAYYTTPFDLLTKALIIPFALIGVMFASFSTDWASNKEKVKNNFKISLLAVSAIMIPFSLGTFFTSQFGLEIWLGKEFAEHSYRVVQWLSLGILLNAFAMVPFALIQATGRADITAKIHLFELPLYVLLLWYLVDSFGIEGAAIAWVIRVGIDAILLLAIAGLLLNIKYSLRKKSGF